MCCAVDSCFWCNNNLNAVIVNDASTWYLPHISRFNFKDINYIWKDINIVYKETLNVIEKWAFKLHIGNFSIMVDVFAFTIDIFSNVVDDFSNKSGKCVVVRCFL